MELSKRFVTTWNLADNFVRCAFYVFLVHKSPLAY
jgi:hypothetical protein